MRIVGPIYGSAFVPDGTDAHNRCYLDGHVFHARLTVDDVSRKLTVVKNCKSPNAKPAGANRQQRQWHLQTTDNNSNKCIPARTEAEYEVREGY